MDDSLDQFMAGIRFAESGSADGVYSARNPSGAYGAYQIMPGNWGSWSESAGYGGASMSDPAAQDAVATSVMTGYYEDYGSWDLVAAAWRLGPGTADRIQENGWAILSDSDKAKIEPYLSKVMPYVGTSSYMGPFGDAPEDSGVPREDQMIPAMFDAMSRKVAEGDRMSLKDLTTLNATATQAAMLEPESPFTDGGLGESTNFEGDEVAGTGPSGSMYTEGNATHTHSENADRLADPEYQQVANNAVAQVGAWIAEQYAVPVNQFRPLGSRPQGGALHSDHYWGGALDITTSDLAQGNQIRDILWKYRKELGVNYILWQEDNHYDHVHVSFLPPASDGAVVDASEGLVALGVAKSGAGVTVPQNVMPTNAEPKGPTKAPEPQLQTSGGYQ